MQPRITVITVGVDDLERAVRFYRDGLGWPTEGIVGAEYPDGAVAFFRLEGGLTFAVWPRGSLARDAGILPTPPSATELSLGHNVRSREEVDRAWERALAAGATPIKPPGPTFWGGYAGYIADPDGHLWELVYNPDLVPADRADIDS
jgi:catechol 2,3-dioxygenase-like lactoylglutathione lyase family enzyme